MHESTYVRRENVEFITSPTHNLTTISTTQCSRECSRTDYCEAFSYNKTSKLCVISAFQTALAEPGAVSDLVIYEKGVLLVVKLISAKAEFFLKSVKYCSPFCIF